MIDTVVIVGAGLAGAKAAQTLRDEGHDGRIVLVGEETHRPYERPPLSKGWLLGQAETDTVFVHGREWAEESGVDLLTGTPARGIDLDQRQVRTDDADIGFDQLLLATGASPRRLSIPGADLPGVHLLRTLDDAESLNAAMAGGARVAIIGAGWIGCEVAAAARHLGCDVVLIDPLAVPLERVLGREVGQGFARLHADHGVELRLTTGVDAITGDNRVDGVVTSDGDRHAADVVVMGVGVTPRVDVARAAGLTIDDGVVADDRLRAAPGVFVAGDVANAYHPRFDRHIRVEHWANALNQGPHAARNMLGADAPYDRLPYFYSDQYDVGLEYVGFAPEWDDVVFRGDADDMEFIAFYRRAGSIAAALTVNVWDVVDHLKALVGTSPDPARLADVDTDLESLAREAQ